MVSNRSRALNNINTNAPFFNTHRLEAEVKFPWNFQISVGKNENVIHRPRSVRIGLFGICYSFIYHDYWIYIRFENYLRFKWIQTYRIFLFSLRLFAKLHYISSWCWIFHGRARCRKIRVYLISKIFVYRCHGKIDFNLANSFWQTSI